MMEDPILAEVEAGRGQRLRELAKTLPPHRRGRPVTLSCILRWITDGASAPDGTRVRLEAVRMPGGWVSTQGAMRRFFQALTPRLDQAHPEIRTPIARQRAMERAAEELSQEGI